MKIEVIGSGCPTCKKMYEFVKAAATELEVKDEVIYIGDSMELVKRGLMHGPALFIDENLVMQGFTSKIETFKEKIQEYLARKE